MLQQLIDFVHNTPYEVLYTDVVSTVLAVERGYTLLRTGSKTDLLRRARAAVAAFIAPPAVPLQAPTEPVVTPAPEAGAPTSTSSKKFTYVNPGAP